MIKLIAHRGASLLCLENTKEAFELAGKSNKVYGIETDVWLTKDNVWVCTHDPNPFLNKKIYVNKSKYADIQNEVLSKDNTSYRLCTFNVFLDICKKYHKSPVIEIKPKNISTSAIKSLLEEVNKYQLLAQSSFISFASKPLKLIKKIEPEALCFNLINARRYCFVQTIRNKILINHLIRKKCNISVHYSLATIKNIAKAHKNALLIGAWTIDDKNLAQQLTSQQLNFITSNDIHLFD